MRINCHKNLENCISLSDDTIKERIEEAGYEFTDDPTEAIYILRDGTLISGFYAGTRTEDHRLIEVVFDDIDRYSPNFWNEMFSRTGVVMLIPETQQALISGDVLLTDIQKSIIKELGFELIKE